ncbi:MAG: DUF6491 family protein [Gammaproteobacteria bacterium]|nr:DUF6491 family protein [Gammaproteobacteria bacterium]
MLITSCCLVACAGTAEQGDSVADDEPRGRGDCIHEPSIRGYTVLDEQNILVEAGGRRQYHVVLSRRAHELRYSPGIWFNSTTSRVCAGFDSIGYKGSMTGRERIESIRELSEEEEEQLLIQFGKKEPEIDNMPEPQEVEGADVEELDEAASE